MSETTTAGRTRGQVLRFLVLGGCNTLITGVLLAVLLRFLTPTLAYTLVFVLGLAATTLLTGRVVFGSELTTRRAAAFVAVYLGVYVVGVLVLNAAPALVDGDPDLLAASVVLATAPLSFLGGRLVFDRPGPSPSSEPGMAP